MQLAGMLKICGAVVRGLVCQVPHLLSKGVCGGRWFAVDCVG